MKPVTALLSSILLTLALSVVACAQKDNEFKGRLTDTIAKASDPSADGQAAYIGEINRLKIDFTKFVEPYYSNEGGGSGVYVQSQIIVNDETTPVFTNHFNPQYNQVPYSAPASTKIGGVDLTVAGYCKTKACRVYYILTEARNETGSLQFAVRWDYDDKSKRIYSVRSSKNGNLYANVQAFMDWIDNPANYVNPH